MRLISCKYCGVVLDTDMIPEPKIRDADGVIIDGRAGWTGDDFQPMIECPCCKQKIFYNGE